MLHLFPLLLAKAGATAITTKVVIAGAVSVAAVGGAGAAGVGPVAELLPSDASSVTIPDERPSKNVLTDLERNGTAAGDGFDRASELAAEEAQEALEAARIAAETAAADAQKTADEARLAAEQKAAEQKPAEQARAEETQKDKQETERRDAPSSSEHVVDQPEVEAQRAPGGTSGGPRG